jgi:hypothetical protein
MYSFPTVDAIPLSAPVWLVKVLHILLLALHFVAVQMMLGSLLLVTVWGLGASRRSDPTRRAAAGRVAGMLPTLMTYLINLGVPPLLFAQLLYGHALYTSSVLIGVWWLAVIGLLVVIYSLLYINTARLAAGKSCWQPALASLLLGGLVAYIFSTNMTLMLRPDAWTALWRADPTGRGLVWGDATLLPRWLYMLCGGLTVGGLTAVMLGGGRRPTPELRRLLLRDGGTVAIAGVLLQAVAGAAVRHAQPDAVSQLLHGSGFYTAAGWLWALLLVAVGLVALAGRRAAARPEVANLRLSWAAALAPVLLSLAATAYRDGIRDFSLLAQGFNVWTLDYVLNPGTLGIFLFLVVLALVIVGVLLAVLLTAAPAEAVSTEQAVVR